MTIHAILFIVGIVCLVAAIVLVLWPRWIAAVPAFIGLALLHWSYRILVPTATFIFWGIATLITVGLFYLSPSGEPDGNRSSNLYIGSSAMAGGMLGIMLAPRLMILGVILGAAMGQLAYSRTPAGKWMLEPSSLFWRYFAAKSLSAIVAVSIVCIAVMGITID